MPTELTDLLHTSLGNLSLTNIASAAVTLLLCLLVIRVVLKVTGRLLDRTRLDSRIRKYVQTGLKALLYFIAALMVVDSLGIPTTSLVALLSVASLGVTLAAEDILANLAGGMVILAAHPFTIGDYIEASGTSGTVEEITLNYTKLLTPDGLTVMLPNKTLADSQMTNYTRLGRRRVALTVTASYTTPTETVKAACHLAMDRTPNILSDPAPAVRLTDYKESAVEYKVFCWASTETYWDVYYALLENLRTAFAETGVERTYGHLNVHILEKTEIHG